MAEHDRAMSRHRHGDGSPPSDAGLEELTQLRELVRAHEICWETRPEYVAGADFPQPVGYVVEISATHAEPHASPHAGCPLCREPLAAIEKVIAFVLPRERRDSIYDVHLMRGSLRYDRRRGNRPEVVATILIEHGDGADRPIDDCERRCLHDIVSRLKQLEACEGQWHPGPFG
jgi:hypothetical protein